MKPIVIFGIGGFGELVHYYFTHDSNRKVAGFTVDREYVKEAQFCGLPVVPFDEVERHFPPAQHEMITCIGYSSVKNYLKIAGRRKSIYLECLAKGYKMASYISSKTSVWPNVQMGDNIIIVEQNILQPFSRIGNNTVLFGNNLVGHHSHIKDHCFLAAGINIAGNVCIEEECFLGMSTTTCPSITIGKSCIITAGSVVNHSMPAGRIVR